MVIPSSCVGFLKGKKEQKSVLMSTVFSGKESETGYAISGRLKKG